MLLVTLLLFFIEFSEAVSNNYPEKIIYKLEEAEILFNNFIQEYEKVYKNENEKQKRLDIFKRNLIESNQLNSEHNHTVFGITQFSDMSQEEFSQGQSCLGPFLGEIRCRRGTVLLHSISNLTASDGETFDWRTKNAVTPVKNQGACNSCYAFSTIGNLEGQYALKYNKLLEFSEQQLVDCDPTCMGCNNGWMSNAGMYLTKVGGAMLRSAYPYTGRRGQCRFDRSKVVARVTGCRQFPNLPEDQLKKLLETTGPISVAVDSKNFRQYRGGIFSYCDKKIDHAVLLVGYGVENGIPYWTIKNTAGPSFGEQGYIRIVRGKNTCGIVNEQIVSLVVG